MLSPPNQSCVDQATEGSIVKVGVTLPDKVVLVKFGELTPNMVVISTFLDHNKCINDIVDEM